MPFNSISFIIFLVVFILLYYTIKGEKGRTLILLLGSYWFYSFGSLLSLLLLLVITFATYLIANRLREKRSGFILSLGILLIVCLLLLTKYASILVKYVAVPGDFESSFRNVFVLPLGISFYSLQAIGLLVDVYGRKYQDDLSLKHLALFLSLFPQSMSGPIHRAKELMPQFRSNKSLTAENIFIGFKLMLWGYTCKLLVADKIDQIISPIFSSFSKFDGLSIFLASLLYSLEIYFDFWGYSLIAIGVGRMLGYQININFVAPYKAKSFQDFWHRWHISLSRWMRDYVYIPLGGRRKESYFLFSLSVLITFIVSGFWHGITLNFILWGFMHALLYILEDIAKRYVNVTHPLIRSKAIQLIRKIAWPLLFFVIISITWLVFRTENIQDLIAMFSNIMDFQSWNVEAGERYFLTNSNLYYLIIVVAILFISHLRIIDQITIRIPITKSHVAWDSVFINSCLLMISLLGDIGGKEFVYFNF